MSWKTLAVGFAILAVIVVGVGIGAMLLGALSSFHFG